MFKKLLLLAVLAILILGVSACSPTDEDLPLVPIRCEGEILRVPFDRASEYKEICMAEVKQPIGGSEEESPVEEVPSSTVVPQLSFVSFVSWNRPFNTPMPKVEGDMVLVYDDYGNSQIFYSCSQERIQENLRLEKLWGIYFTIYWGYDTDADKIISDATERIDTDSMAKILDLESWSIKKPEEVVCAVKVVQQD